MIHEDFNGSVPGFYEKFVGLLPRRDVLMEQFVAELAVLPLENVVEIGMGNGSLAQQLLRQFPTISSYVGIEPAVAMVAAVPQVLLSDGRFFVMTQGFEEWKGEGECVDVVISRYVLHDFPDQLESWYRKIAHVLKPGGFFLNLDVALADNEEETSLNLSAVIELARSVVVDSAKEAEAKQVFIRHLEGEGSRYRSLAYHLELLGKAGLDSNVLTRLGNNYLLRAVKSRPRNPQGE